MRKTILALMSLLSIMACEGRDNPTNDNDGKEDAVVKAPHIFVGKTEGYHTFRIPAIVKTKAGTLLAFCEGRKVSGSDTGDINLVLRRSTDGGNTWGSLITVWDDKNNTCGNPSPVVDPVTGRVHLLMTWNYSTDGKAGGDFNKPGATVDTRRVFYTYSDDDGKTWTTPEEITSSTKKEDWGWYATGPCHGIILNGAAHKGRIVIPCDHVVIGGSGYSHVIYSDDSGKTWHIGGEVKGGNESCVAELPDGRIIITCRVGSGHRMLAYSSDGGETFTKGVDNKNLPDPRCQASILDVTYQSKGALIHSNCADSKSRVNMMIRGSVDNGETWRTGQLVWDKNTAYSDMVMIDDNTIGLFYENGETSSYQRISFERVPLNFAFIK